MGWMHGARPDERGGPRSGAGAVGERTLGLFLCGRRRAGKAGQPDALAAAQGGAHLRISLEHLNSGAATIIFDSCGSSGNSAMMAPTWRGLVNGWDGMGLEIAGKGGHG